MKMTSIGLILLCLTVIHVSGLGTAIYNKLIETIAPGQTIDLMHCMDSSGSITEMGFNSEKAAAKDINNMIHMLSPIVPGGTQVSVVEYSSYPLTNIVLHFGHAPTRKDVNDFISNMTFDGGPYTATAYGLLLAYFEFYTHSPHASPNLLWLYTDGQSSFSTGDPHWPAYWMKRQGTTICVMGIGNNVNLDELQDIGSPGCVFHFPTWKVFKKALKFATQKVEEYVKTVDWSGR